MDTSYIIAINTSYELTTYFLENLLTQIAHSPQENEIIFVIDGPQSIKSTHFLEDASQRYANIKLFYLKKQSGFSAANNYGVRQATGENLVFINSDVFPEENCIQVLLEKLNSSDRIGAVQPLLIYPQTNLVQSTGHLFVDYESKQVFQMRSPSDQVVQMPGTRQALTMALCVMKREIYEKFGGLDEYYYNSHEGMELTLKITLGQYECVYWPAAVAYHCSGGSRDSANYDIVRQKTQFYIRWNDKIKIDLDQYLSMQITSDLCSRAYCVVNFSKSRIWKNILSSLKIRYSNFFESEAKYEQEINLYYWLPCQDLKYPGSYLFLCDNIMCLKNNYNWFKVRNRDTDLLFDLNGNVVFANQWILKNQAAQK